MAVVDDSEPGRERDSIADNRLDWDDPSFNVASDPARRAKYRRLQSWYRQNVLGVEAGEDSTGRRLGSMLPAAAVQADPTLNFLRDERLARIALDRLAESRGTFVEDRLKRNLLSSQPMCVNLFGMFKLYPDEAALVLRTASELPIKRVDCVEIEVAPEHATAILADRTAFDAYVEYRDPEGTKRFIAIETKYTEPFSNDLGLEEKKRDKYRRLAADFKAFRSPLSPELLTPQASQLFRNVLLAMAHTKSTQMPGVVLVVALADDPAAAAGVHVVREQLLAPDDHLHEVSIEALVDSAAVLPTFGPWARSFRQRYLELPPA